MTKRLLVLFLSFGTIIAFGYALGGLGGYMYDKGKPLVIAAGLIGGCLSAAAAIRIWRSYLSDIEAEDAAKKLANDSSQAEQED